jgi:toxin YoeB
MGKFIVLYEKQARNDLLKHKQSGNLSNMKKIQKILSELEQHPYTGEGQPEALKYDLLGFWSRRINKKDRIVYKVEEDIVTVLVVSAMGHYEK